MKVTTGLELAIGQRNEVGVGAEIFSIVGDLQANIIAISAWVNGPDAFFRIVIDKNHGMVISALRDFGYDVEQREILMVELPNNPGRLAAVLQQLAVADIDVDHAYASGTPECRSLVVLKTSDNELAAKELNSLD